ncbi:uncharacterized protein LOC116265655 [Nymphaea colorata]|uniref:uncharacterized protein LOC116265655 n=1 Tax=Nymphaea colorata TaxID=210225 RepID=UPI00129E0F73|nr:uncharacterized protein LOC116265655 [Nymphaea colorata]
MGSLATHFSAFLFLFPLGVRRLVCAFSLYLRSPPHYQSRTWYISEPKWKNLDLYVLCVTLPLAAFSEVFWFLTFNGQGAYRFSFFQEAAVILLFWLIVLIVLIRENLDVPFFHENVLFLFAGVAFLVDCATLGKDAGSGLAGRSYQILAGLSLVCSASCLLLSYQPRAFVAEFALSAGLVLKGTWFLQSGLSLFSSGFLPSGCHRAGGLNGSVKCELEEDGLRGMAIIDLLFVGHALGVLILSVAMFGMISRKHDSRFTAGGLSLGERESEAMLMHPLPTFELE